MGVLGGTPKVVLEAYVERGLAPARSPGQAVVYDGLGAHDGGRAGGGTSGRRAALAEHSIFQRGDAIPRPPVLLSPPPGMPTLWGR
jgi:hypothetical protein